LGDRTQSVSPVRTPVLSTTQVKTVDGKPVLKDFDALRKRYATVFRESGVGLRGGWRKRFRFEVCIGIDIAIDRSIDRYAYMYICVDSVAGGESASDSRCA